MERLSGPSTQSTSSSVAQIPWSFFSSLLLTCNYNISCLRLQGRCTSVALIVARGRIVTDIVQLNVHKGV